MKTAMFNLPAVNSLVRLKIHIFKAFKIGDQSRG